METIIATGLPELSLNNEELPLSIHKVESSDDMLNEVLLRLPVVSLVLFKSVSKRWLSLIKDDTFIKRRNQILKIEPPSGLFVHFRFRYDDKVLTRVSVPFDIRIPSQDKKFFKTVPSSDPTLLQSCNGLFLCSVMYGRRFCVYNPTSNLFKVLPKPHYYKPKLDNFIRMAFDPTKSPHYKVVHATPICDGDHFRIQTYSSETSIWSIVCSRSDPIQVPFSCYFSDAIYLNDAIHWIHDYYDHRGFHYRLDYVNKTTVDHKCFHYKLDFVNKTAVLTKIQLPVTMDKYYCRLFESRGCLLLLGKGKTNYDHLNVYVYEIRNGRPEWTFKYFVNYWKISTKGAWFSCIQGVSCISLGEREEDSFMVLVLDGKVFRYKFVLKNPHELPELLPILPGKGDYKDSFLFTASFASV